MELIQRLREPGRGKTEHEAADEIERLRAELETSQSLVRGYVALLQGEIAAQRPHEQKGPQG